MLYQQNQTNFEFHNKNKKICRGAGGCNADPGSLNVDSGRNVGGPGDNTQARGH
jgi:hypothetical protein